MAGDYIVVRVDLHEDPAVFHIARQTGLNSDEVVGRLVRVWRWAQAHSASGKIPVVSRSDLDQIAGRDGFADAMASTPESPWLIINDTGGVEFPGWDRWMSKGAKYRLGEQLRSRDRREQSTRNRENDRKTSGSSTGKRPGKRPGNDRENPGIQRQSTETERCTEGNANRQSTSEIEIGPADAVSGARTVALPLGDLTEGEVRECVECIRRRCGHEHASIIRAGPPVILEHLGCDRSFTAALRRSAETNGGATRAFWGAMLEYARLRNQPYRPGGWWREALARNGLDLRRNNGH